MSKFKKLLLVSSGILFFILAGCCSSDYIWVKVQKSVLIPDSYELNRDSLIVGGIRICKMAQRFYNKSVLLDGGGNSFTGFAIPPYLVKTQYGNYSLAYVKDKSIRITCNGNVKGFDQLNPMKVEFVVNSNTISAVVLN